MVYGFCARQQLACCSFQFCLLGHGMSSSFFITSVLPDDNDDGGH